MPQLDFESFPTQLFWLAITFAVLYWIMSRVALPKVGEVIDARAAKIDGDLAAAECARQATADLVAAHRAAMLESQVEAQRILKAAGDQLAAEQAKREAELKSHLDAELESAEQRIAKARDAALDQLPRLSAEAAIAAVARLGGEAPSLETAEATVERVRRELAA